MTAVGPTLRTTTRSARGPVAVAAVLLLVALAAAALSATGSKAALDPSAYTSQGTHAIAALLTDRGVPVRRVDTVEALDRSGAGTVLVPAAEMLIPSELRQLATVPGRLVVVGASGAALVALGVPVLAAPPVPVEPRAAACDLPAAVRAGDVDLGGPTYRATGPAAECYASGGRATLVQVGRVTLLGSPDLLTNARLDHRGNAALALGLLGAGRDVQWLLPRPGARTTATDQSLNDLLPGWLTLAVLQVAVAVAVLALLRARQLGPAVTEPLPVVVRAAEAVEGRGRLYRASGARATAAESLREGARDRLHSRLGLGQGVAPEAVVAAVVGRTGRDPVELQALLYGAAPTDDDALVLLADELDILIAEVAGS